MRTNSLVKFRATQTTVDVKVVHSSENTPPLSERLCQCSCASDIDQCLKRARPEPISKWANANLMPSTIVHSIGGRLHHYSRRRPPLPSDGDRPLNAAGAAQLQIGHHPARKYHKLPKADVLRTELSQIHRALQRRLCLRAQPQLPSMWLGSKPHR